jgi:hypothetical protein
LSFSFARIHFDVTSSSAVKAQDALAALGLDMLLTGAKLLCHPGKEK